MKTAEKALYFKLNAAGVQPQSGKKAHPTNARETLSVFMGHIRHGVGPEKLPLTTKANRPLRQSGNHTHTLINRVNNPIV